jgi:hypothetical protein
MEALNIISNVCSILSLVITLFVANQVTRIKQEVSGRGNIVAGGDAHVRR